MAGMDSSELSVARENLDKAIREFITVRAAEKGHQGVYVTGWVGFAEYLNKDMIDNDQTASCALVPDDQSRATTRGLFEFGIDSFGRSS